MPNITVIRKHLFDAIGKSYTDHEFDELCFEFGVEVDDVATEIIEFTGDGSKEEHVVYVIAIPANRYDLLCLEGFARALKIFIGLQTPPIFRLSNVSQSDMHIMHVHPSTQAIRPYVVCAILRGIQFDTRKYKNFIDLQDKLHQNICRKRTYVAIGTHDMDTIQGPFHYRALPPQEINFVPLTENEGKSYNSKELLDFYREDPSAKHLKPYTDIIYNSPVYPVVSDNNGVVLSLPPIINSKHSRIQMHTHNVFIECTATDITKANIVLDTMVTMFSEYCQEPFVVEPVRVVYESSGSEEIIPGNTQVTPLLSSRSCDARVDEINGTIGVSITPEEMCRLCDRMQLGPAVYHPSADASSNGFIKVQVPPTRSDILHPVDVIEDIAIAYGYNNIKLEVPKTLCFGAPLPINHFTDLLRAELARAGYIEMLTHGLCSTAENFTHLKRPIGPAVSLSNPANIEYEVVRTTLLPGALKTLSYNKSMSHKDGVRLFEISDVVIPTNNEIGAKNVRKLVGLYSSYSSGFEVIHGLADRVMTCVQIQPEHGYASNSLTPEELADLKRVARSGVVYYVKPSNDPCFFQGMSADLMLKYSDGRPDVSIGSLGVVHPEVLQNFEISYPCSVIEMDIESVMP
eukprot:gene9765-13136_t